MTILSAYRIVKTNRSLDSKTINGLEIPAAFDGYGSSMFGGRWNSKETHIVYTSDTQALAVLEILVHLDDPEMLNAFSVFPVSFDDKYMLTVDDVAGGLPSDWQNEPFSQNARDIGDAWIKSAQSLVLAVPSAVIPNEYNYLLNPYHKDFKAISIGEAAEFPLDARLMSTADIVDITQDAG